MDIREKYQHFITIHLPNVLTQIDRDPDSPTYGSCDRNFWHYKMRDFSSAILQQSGLLLAKLTHIPFEGNAHYKNAITRELAVATLDFWCKIQLKDGSFNEYYPYEHGFPPTAFSLYSACETYRTLELSDAKYIAAFRKTADFLSKNIEEKASNQEMASITALYSFYLISQDNSIKDSCQHKLKRFLSTQSAEGWFPEYGGADLGYQSVCLDMLAEYYALSKDERVVEPMRRVVNFMRWFVHPDGSIGGEYGSRNTIYCLPFGFELLSTLGDKHALAMRNAIFQNSDTKEYFQHAIDDRYFAHYVLHSFARSLDLPELETTTAIPLPCQQNGQQYFPESGLLSLSTPNYYCICSTKKGGMLKVYKGTRAVFANYGYRISLNDGSLAASNWLDEAYEVEYNSNREFTIQGAFNKIKPRTSSPILHIGLRVLSFLLGKHLITFLKSKMIFVDKHIKTRFTRQIQFGEDTIRIRDEIFSPQRVTLKSAPPFSLRHVASSKFYSATDLLPRQRILLENVEHAEVQMVWDTNSEECTLQQLGDK